MRRNYMGNLSIFFIMIFSLCFACVSSAVTGQEFKAIKKNIQNGTKLTPEQMILFKNIIKNAESDQVHAKAFKEIAKNGVINVAQPKNNKAFRTNVAKEFGRIAYEIEKPITDILKNLIQSLDMLSEVDLMEADVEEWEIRTKTNAQKLVSEAKVKIIEFFGNHYSFSHLKNPDGIAAFKLALKYGIADLVEYFINNREHVLKKDELDLHLKDIENFENNSINNPQLQELAWFNTGEGSDFEKCKTIIIRFYQLQEHNQ